MLFEIAMSSWNKASEVNLPMYLWRCIFQISLLNLMGKVGFFLWGGKLEIAQLKDACINPWYWYNTVVDQSLDWTVFVAKYK